MFWRTPTENPKHGRRASWRSQESDQGYFIGNNGYPLQIFVHKRRLEDSIYIYFQFNDVVKEEFLSFSMRISEQALSFSVSLSNPALSLK